MGEESSQSNLHDYSRQIDGDGDDETDDDSDAVDSTTPTYRWTPEGAACDWCGKVVERRWADDGDDSDDSDSDDDDDDAVTFVCDDCKEW